MMAWQPMIARTSRLTPMSVEKRQIEQRVQNSIVADVMGLGIGATSPDWAIRTAIADELTGEGMNVQRATAIVPALVAGAVSAVQLIDASPKRSSKSIMQSILAHAGRTQSNFDPLVESTCRQLIKEFTASGADLDAVGHGAAQGAGVVAGRWKKTPEQARADVDQMFARVDRQSPSDLN